MKKNVGLLLLTLAIVFSLTACGGKSEQTQPAPVPEQTTPEPATPALTVPDVAETDEATAKNVLSALGLIPTIAYEYDDEAEENLVIKTEPAVGSEVKPGDKVKVFVSKGPRVVYVKDGMVTLHRDTGLNNAESTGIYIEEGILCLQFENVTFWKSCTWKDTYQRGEIMGRASITDVFDKTVPISATYEKQSWEKDEPQAFTVKVPLSELNVTRPTDLYLKLVLDTEESICIDVFMTW